MKFQFPTLHQSLKSIAWIIGVVSSVLGIAAYFANDPSLDLRQDLARIENAVADQKNVNEQLILLLRGSQRLQEDAAAVGDSQSMVRDKVAGIKQSVESGSAKDFSASQARLLLLSAKAADLELRAQFIAQKRITLASTVEGIFATFSEFSQGPEKKAYLARIRELQHIDKQLELMLHRIDTQHTALETEIAVLKRILEDSTDKSFKLFG